MAWLHGYYIDYLRLLHYQPPNGVLVRRYFYSDDLKIC